jgi:hypothetical protein
MPYVCYRRRLITDIANATSRPSRGAAFFMPGDITVLNELR